MKNFRKINKIMLFLQVGAAVILALMMAKAMNALFFLLKGESIF